MEITISLTAAEVRCIGDDALKLTEILDSHLWAMAMLRTGVNFRDSGSLPPTLGDWAAVLWGGGRLTPRLQGIRSGAIRAFMAAGGTEERLADVLGLDRPTVEEVLGRLRAGDNGDTSDFELWAMTRKPEDRAGESA
ncbi:hypothetical protein FDA94_27050 [Herbidospora galbida]|uniref:Uncharacterized protein n=1 Tax=Herbidospora galbida TaxID=2575442 RepID=A0A4V5UYV8_9ACTN|nr:hypothetical protein [Herbidospora galbida]TKK85083.1 hypothetical protein FDA94_27050 [Herbidospora galbida]